MLCPSRIPVDESNSFFIQVAAFNVIVVPVKISVGLLKVISLADGPEFRGRKDEGVVLLSDLRQNSSAWTFRSTERWLGYGTVRSYL